MSSARNYLTKVFGVRPRVSDRGYRVTVELAAFSRSDYLAMVSKIDKEIARLGVSVVKSSEYYGSGDNPLYAICADVPEEVFQEFVSQPYVKGYGVGYCYPNAGNILNYMNLEHPPLGKYLVAIAMVTCGDRPVCWRLPSVISGAMVLVVQYALLGGVLGGFWGGVISVVVPIVTMLDRTFRSMTLVAMLDAPLALLTYIACFFSVRGKVYRSSALLSLASSTKFSGAFIVPALYPDYSRKVPPALAVLLLLYAPLAVFVAMSIPLILFKGGFLQWWSEAVEGAFRWHITTKTEPGKGPPIASPWDWITGANSFILHYKYEEGSGFVADLIASGNPVLYISTALASILVIPRLRKLPDGGRVWTYTWLTWLMYVFLWLAGNKSQYSFYMVQIVPLLYTLLGILAYHLSEVTNLKDVSKAWVEIAKNVVRYLRGEIKVGIKVEINPPSSGGKGKSGE